MSQPARAVRPRRSSFAAGVVWNGIFDYLITRGEREYFWSQARAESGAGPPVVLHDMMQATISYAAVVGPLVGGRRRWRRACC